MNKKVCNYDCYVTTICVSNNLLKKRDWWCYLQAVWMIRSKVFPVFYRVVFMNGCEEGVLNGKKWRQQDIGDIEVSKFNKHKNTFQFVYLQSCISQGFPPSSVKLPKKSQWKNAWQAHTERETNAQTHWCCYLFFIHTVLLTHFAEDLRHLKRPRGVHVGSDDGDASVGLFGVAECEGPLKIYLVSHCGDVFHGHYIIANQECVLFNWWFMFVSKAD